MALSQKIIMIQGRSLPGHVAIGLLCQALRRAAPEQQAHLIEQWRQNPKVAMQVITAEANQTHNLAKSVNLNGLKAYQFNQLIEVTKRL